MAEMETTARSRLTPPRQASDAALEVAPVVLRGSRLTSLISAAGSGQIRYDNLAVTRWTGDATPDADGVFVYLRDVETGLFWSVGLQPAACEPVAYDVEFSPDRAVFRRLDDGVRSEMEVCVDAGRDVELRRITITNEGSRPRRLELTSYLEWVLQDAASDAAHPAFSKIFIETRFAPERNLIVARRRPREPAQSILVGGHWIVGERSSGDLGDVEFETSRMAFIGRGRSLRAPAALTQDRRLSGAVGPVLDPIASMRRSFYLPSDESAVIVLATAARSDPKSLLEAAEDLRLDDVHEILARPSAPHEFDAELRREESADGAPARRRVDPMHSAPSAADVAYQPLHERAPAAVDGETGTLEFDNGLGGFTPAGNEYVIRLRPDESGGLRLPPLPWSHVVANPQAGFIATETGAGYTWTVNSRENRLTHWSNDPVCDPHSEVLYLRDGDRQVYWTPTPGPAGPNVAHEVRYGFGYAEYRQTSGELRQRVEMFVPRQDPVKLTRLELENLSAGRRRLDLFFYAHLALGNGTRGQGEQIRTWFDAESNCVFAVNEARELGQRVTFAALVAPDSSQPFSFTCDRTEFLGRHGELSAPAAVCSGRPLAGRAGEGLDPCAAIQASLELAAGEQRQCWVILGEAENIVEAKRLLAKYATSETVDTAAKSARQFWSETLSAVQIETPSKALDFMVNGWLPYQNLSCRMWGRSAYYQSGGAYGFRDQLQDSAALVHHCPELTRQQLLEHASNQFVEGDVMHWWHPPNGRGIRTRFSDDLLWLPLLTAEYCQTTGDANLWDATAPYLTGPLLDDGEAERFFEPKRARESGSMYDHACRAIDRSLAVGTHGLPLMGCGDWNDGMNRVGRLGRGESVWMGFFLYHALEALIPVCLGRGERRRADQYREHQTRLRAALNGPGWDGHWFRRAFFDDGAPLGSAASSECQIDLLAQAWAVISGAGDADFSRKGMSAVEQRLVDEGAGLIRLLDPPFDQMANDPGYIKGYLPGIRENGGQYTHGALWYIRAVAELGRGTRAVELLEMINPINHARTAGETAVYQAEPYVVAADVYSQPPHAGRAGWTWYTGSAGWMWRVAVESVLGCRVRLGREFVINPRISAAWRQCRLAYRLPGSGAQYRIAIENPDGRENTVRSATLDGTAVQIVDGAAHVPIVKDGKRHDVEIVL
jgi:N,N'-diacetylchitobiose phosphorylase